MPNEVPQDCWQIVTVDMITDLPRCHGFDCIWMICVDRFSKCIHVAPITKELDSVGHAQLFRDYQSASQVASILATTNTRVSIVGNNTHIHTIWSLCSALYIKFIIPQMYDQSINTHPILMNIKYSYSFKCEYSRVLHNQ
jgi:hypothetical protein